jgi:hypothetical protein
VSLGGDRDVADLDRLDAGTCGTGKDDHMTSKKTAATESAPDTKPEASVKGLVAYLKKQPGSVNSASIAEALGCSKPMALGLIAEGKAAGTVFQAGNRRSARYGATQNKADKPLGSAAEQPAAAT